MSPSATWINFDSRVSTSSPTYPASVRLVASPMTSGTFKYAARDLTRWVLPEPEGPISRMLDFSTTTSRRSASATIGSGAPQSQASTSRLKWLETPRARRLLAMSCPITYWSRWATRVLGDGIEARSASFDGRSGGGTGSGTGWGLMSASALVAQKAQMRVVESKPPSKSGTLELKQKSQQTGCSSDIGHQRQRRIRTTHARWSNTPPRWCQSFPNGLVPPLGLAGV